MVRTINTRTLLAYFAALTPLLFSYYIGSQQVLISDVVVVYLGATFLLSGTGLVARSYLCAIFVFAIWILTSLFLNQFMIESYSSWAGLSIPARMLLYYVAALPVGMYFRNGDSLQKAVIASAIALAIYALAQLAVYVTTGITLVTGIPLLSQRFGLELSRNYAEIFSVFGYRASSLFTEPAHLAQYCGIAALLLLQKLDPSSKGGRPRFFSAIFLLLMVAPLAAGSSTAVFSAIFLTTTVSLLGAWSGIVKGRVGITLIGILALLFLMAVAAAISNPVAISRVVASLSTDVFISDASALFVRVLRPFFYLDALFRRGEFFALAFGHGYGTYEQVLVRDQLTTEYEEVSQVYWVNTFGLTISAVGLVGFIILSLVFYSLFAYTENSARPLLLFLYSSLFFSDMAASAFAFLVIAIVVSNPRRGNGVKRKLVDGVLS